MLWGYKDFTSSFSIFGGDSWWEYTDIHFESYNWVYFGHSVGVDESPADSSIYFEVSGCDLPAVGAVCIFIYLYTYIYVCIKTHLFVCVCACVCVCVRCVRLCVNICIYIYIYIYIYI